LFATNVCQQPSINDTNSLGASHRKTIARKTWVWTGTGACKSCNDDNQDMTPPAPQNITSSSPSPSTASSLDVPTADSSSLPTTSPKTPFTRKPTSRNTIPKSSRMPTTQRPTGTPITVRPTPSPKASKPTSHSTASVPTNYPAMIKSTSFPTTTKPTRVPTTSKPTFTNTSKRKLQIDTFLDSIQIKLMSLFWNQVIPKHFTCLGNSPDVNIEVTRIGIAEVTQVCQNTTLPFLGVSNLDKSKFFAFQKALCGSCISLDFSNTNATVPIVGGTYINTQWKDSYGVTVTASSMVGGYTPNGHARIYDTSISINANDGNIDLGSPNVNCGGIGVGFDGQPGQPGENCVAINSKYFSSI
jgi:hypothetical protein